MYASGKKSSITTITKTSLTKNTKPPVRPTAKTTRITALSMATKMTSLVAPTAGSKTKTVEVKKGPTQTPNLLPRRTCSQRLSTNITDVKVDPRLRKKEAEIQFERERKKYIMASNLTNTFTPAGTANNLMLTRTRTTVGRKNPRDNIGEGLLTQPSNGRNSNETPKAKELVEMGVQSKEDEILNYDLLIGDIKFMMPSKALVNQIDRERDEIKKKELLRSQRKFEQHAEKEEEHLTSLKEFLEKAVITKRVRKTPHREPFMIDRKLIKSMDELLKHEVPKTESITDIKARIKKKEQELLGLFESVENIKILSNKQN